MYRLEKNLHLIIIIFRILNSIWYTITRCRRGFEKLCTMINKIPQEICSLRERTGHIYEARTVKYRGN